MTPCAVARRTIQSPVNTLPNRARRITFVDQDRQDGQAVSRPLTVVPVTMLDRTKTTSRIVGPGRIGRPVILPQSRRPTREMALTLMIRPRGIAMLPDPS